MENIKPSLFCSSTLLAGKKPVSQTVALPWHHQGIAGVSIPAPPAEKANHGGGKAKHAFHSQSAAGTGMQQPAGAEGPKGDWQESLSQQEHGPCSNWAGTCRRTCATGDSLEGEQLSQQASAWLEPRQHLPPLEIALTENGVTGMESPSLVLLCSTRYMKHVGSNQSRESWSKRGSEINRKTNQHLEMEQMDNTEGPRPPGMLDCRQTRAHAWKEKQAVCRAGHQE